MKHILPPKLTEDTITVAVAGCGGNGSQILSGLARMNLALRALGHEGFEVFAFDPDTVTDANVGRQLFSPSDIGCNKAEVLINRLNCYYGFAWEAVPTAYDQRADIEEGPHFLIGCVDSAAARRDLARTKFHYWLDLGNKERTGQVILGQPFEYHFKSFVGWRAEADEAVKQRLPNVLELFPELMNAKLKEDDAPSCSLAEALGRQDLFINQSVATFALQLLWQFIRQGGLDIQGYFINLENGRVTPLPIQPPLSLGSPSPRRRKKGKKQR